MSADDDSSTTSARSSNSNEYVAVSVTEPPSHVLQDGTFVHLPPPTDRDKTRFFERTVARHGLLRKYLSSSSTKTSTEPDVEDDGAKIKTAPKIHPLALASARLQFNGINELNRAINLHTLVATGEYFGLSNVVDPSLERLSTSTADKPSSTTGEAGSDGRQSGGMATGVEAAEVVVQPVDEEEARVRALYVLKRNRAQFEQAVVTLKRHGQRLASATVAQRQVDQRLRQLRPVWKLVAPEHGTRALPHAVKPTEAVCADVDVYFGNSVGRLAGRVPRFATMELCDDYNVHDDLKRWKEMYFPNQSLSADAMEIDQDAPSRETPSDRNIPADSSSEAGNKRICTRAESFSIADPSLGKIDTDFDPYNVAMLTLQCDMEKASTGFCVSARLQPFTCKRRAATTPVNGNDTGDDEKTLIALHHSLFTAKLFESIRRELAPDTESIGHVRTTAKTQSAVWLAGESEENYLPPPSLTITSPHSGGLAPLCIVHVHEGDVKVLLDCEYSLRIRLVETNEATASADTNAAASGSQSPKILQLLCDALLLHIEERYHTHSVRKEARLRREQLEESQRQIQFLKDNPHVKVVPPMKAKETAHTLCTLQSSVSLGAKMLFELRIRKVLKAIKEWLALATKGIDTAEQLHVEWLALSVFDLASQFTVSYGGWSVDATIVCDELTIARFGQNGEYRKAKFHSDKEFELFLKTSLKRVVCNINTNS
jgi:hypothetical protein